MHQWGRALPPTNAGAAAAASQPPQVEPRLAGGNAEREPAASESLEYFRTATTTPFLAAGGFSRASAVSSLQEGKADGIVFGE